MFPRAAFVPCLSGEPASSRPCPPPFQGVLRIHFIEAQDLQGKDTYLKGLVKGKSDPYGVLRVGNQIFQSKVIKESLSPKWNEVYEVRRAWGCCRSCPDSDSTPATGLWSVRWQLKLCLRKLPVFPNTGPYEFLLWHSGLRTRLPQLRSLQKRGFDPWPRNFHMCGCGHKVKKKIPKLQSHQTVTISKGHSYTQMCTTLRLTLHCLVTFHLLPLAFST